MTEQIQNVSGVLFQTSYFTSRGCLTQLGSLANIKKKINKNVLVVEVYESHSVVCVHVLCACVCVWMHKGGGVWLSGVWPLYPPSESTCSDPPQVSQVWLNLFHLRSRRLLFSFLIFFPLSLLLLSSVSFFLSHTRAHTCVHTQVKILEQAYLKHTRLLKTPPHA